MADVFQQDESRRGLSLSAIANDSAAKQSVEGVHIRR
jgi:hypothetical protein